MEGLNNLSASKRLERWLDSYKENESKMNLMVKALWFDGPGKFSLKNILKKIEDHSFNIDVKREVLENIKNICDDFIALSKPEERFEKRVINAKDLLEQNILPKIEKLESTWKGNTGVDPIDSNEDDKDVQNLDHGSNKKLLAI